MPFYNVWTSVGVRQMYIGGRILRDKYIDNLKLIDGNYNINQL